MGRNATEKKTISISSDGVVVKQKFSFRVSKLRYFLNYTLKRYFIMSKKINTKDFNFLPSEYE
jgi:hypothetical protein